MKPALLVTLIESFIARGVVHDLGRAWADDPDGRRVMQWYVRRSAHGPLPPSAWSRAFASPGAAKISAATRGPRTWRRS
jgi:hypothetical protein